jgi:hypothetical protein
MNMIDLMKYTYMMLPEQVERELDKLWNKYTKIINKKNPSWEELNEARSILYLTGHVYCEQIAVDAIERRLHLLRVRITLPEFLTIIDTDSAKADILRREKLFCILEEYYTVIKSYKNKYLNGKYYMEEEKFLEQYNKNNPHTELKLGYAGSFGNK